MTIQEMYDEKGKLVHRGRELVLAAKEEKRSLTAEEKENCDKIDAEIRSLQGRIDTAEAEARFASHEREMETVSRKAPRHTGHLESNEERVAGFYESDEARSLFIQGFKTGDMSAYAARANEIDGGATTGAVLLPTELQREIERIIRDDSDLLRIVRQRTTNATVDIPRGLAFGAATWLDNQDAYPNPAVTFDKVSLAAYKLGTLIPVTEEMEQDDATELQRYIVEESGNAFAEAIEEAIVNGSGTGEPTGFLANLTQEVKVAGTFDSDAPVTPQDLVKLTHAVKPSVGRRGTFVLNDALVSQIRLLTVGVTDTNNFLWQPGLSAGQPDRILGHPYVVSAAMPDGGTADERIVAFGDFNRAYTVANRRGFNVMKLTERYADQGIVAWRFMQRLDGKLVKSDALAYIDAADV